MAPKAIKKERERKGAGDGGWGGTEGQERWMEWGKGCRGGLKAIHNMPFGNLIRSVILRETLKDSETLAPLQNPRMESLRKREIKSQESK